MQTPLHYITLYIIDCMPIVQFGLNIRFAQEPDFKILGAATSTTELIEQITHQPSSVILLDYSLSRDDFDGAHLLRRLRRVAPTSRILVWASEANTAYATLALRAGATGYLAKTHGDLQQLVDAVRAVAAGRTYIAPEFASSDFKGLDASADEPCDDLETIIGKLLSLKEVEVLRCCLDCMTMTEIAAKFNRSVKTISTQKYSAYRKLGIRNDRELFKVFRTLMRTDPVEVLAV